MEFLESLSAYVVESVINECFGTFTRKICQYSANKRGGGGAMESGSFFLEPDTPRIKI